MCSKCRALLHIPPPLRLQICLSRLAIHFQHNFGGPESNECDVFIRYIVYLQSKLYRQQDTPSNNERAKVLELMTKIGKFWSPKEYGYISMIDPQNITCEPSDKLGVQSAGTYGSCGLSGYAPISCELDETHQDPFVKSHRGGSRRISPSCRSCCVEGDTHAGSDVRFWG
jgi:hypothetical protein